MFASEHHKSNKKWWILTLVLFIIGAIITQINSNERYARTSDGKCDICDEYASWKLDGHEYCDKHAGNKMVDDFYDTYG